VAYVSPNRLTYNGVQIQDVLTRVFDIATVYDPTGTDRIGVKFTIAVSGMILGLNSLGENGPDATYRLTSGGDSTSLAAQFVEIRRRLTQPRGTLEFYAGGSRILRATSSPGASDGDTQNGPHPEHLHTTQIVGGTLHVEYRISCVIADVPGGLKSPILNHRWSCTDSYDPDWSLTRSTRGRVVLASAAANHRDFRSLGLPRLQDGFVRSIPELTVAPDGLAIEYIIADRRVHRVPPPPAVAWTGQRSVETDSGIGAMVSADIALRGEPGAPTAVLLARALQIALGCVNLNRQSFLNGGAFLRRFAWREGLHEATVQVSIDAQSTAEGNPMFAVDSSPIGKPLNLSDYDETRAMILPVDLHGTAEWFCAALQDVSVDNHARDTTPAGSGTGGTGSGVDGNRAPLASVATPQVAVLNPLTSLDEIFEAGHASKPYAVYSLSSSYSWGTGTTQIPIADTDPANRDQPTCVFVPMSRGKCQRRIKIHGQRANAMPKMPEPIASYTEPCGAHATLLEVVELTFAPVVPAPDGSGSLHECRAEFVYGLDRPPGLKEAFSAGRVPWLKSDGSSGAVVNGSEIFESGLL